ncbi:MAG: hypothetical protein C0613_09620 [Desulfobulbaceae bacterium]|nr:MAG: hypothetical protein C0613_09620 [Desulfobulbaceae bacterium]
MPSHDNHTELALLTDAFRRLSCLHGSLGLDYPRSAAFTAPARRQPSVPPEQHPPVAAPPPPAQQQVSAPAQRDLTALRESIGQCRRCPTVSDKAVPLFGSGKEERPALLLVGDAATSTVIRENAPFAGPAGELLAKMLAAINLSCDDVFQTNIIRCALPDSATDLPGRLANCQPHLIEQIKLMRPHIICTMGQLASQTLLSTNNKLIALRGRFHQFHNIPLVATYHPARLIEVPDLKKAAWYDLQLIQHRLRQLHL